MLWLKSGELEIGAEILEEDVLELLMLLLRDSGVSGPKGLFTSCDAFSSRRPGLCVFRDMI